MGIGVSVFLLAVGAILAFAIEVNANGIDLNTVGVILMIAGLVGLLTSMFFWESWGGFGGGVSRSRTYVRDDLADPVDVVDVDVAPRRVVRGRRVVRDGF